MRHPDLAYLSWARSIYGQVRLDLASSNAPTPPWEALGITPADLQLLAGDHRAGPPGLLEMVGDTYGFQSNNVACAGGASGVMALLCRALLTPGAGDHVVCESPIYEPLRAVPAGMGGEITLVRRQGPGGSGDLEADLVIQAIRSTTRMVVLTSLHNPSGRRIPAETLQAIAKAADDVGAVVVVDEVYLEFCGAEVEPSAHLSPAIVSVNSVTKVLGLGGLRIGWALCQDEALIARLRAAFLHDSVILSGPSVEIAIHALRRRGQLIERARAGLPEALNTVVAWAEGRSDVAFHPPDAGHMAWLELKTPGLTGRALADRLIADFGTVVAPGDFFGDSAGVRIGFGRPADVLAEGLANLGEALDLFRG